ncbi:MAG: polyribonucleotide nucleotidyltransferase [Bacteroidia bacterium]|nr:polyribonucleotide nucleotidyltransferase [Bacteroidia bacterium]MCZ2249957.1 polyribonucleotide nucleotidyltransferase [Bacteroidia bacterium]
MSQQAIIKTFDLGDGRQISIETGKLAKQADGSVVVRMGNTMLLATVCAKKEAGENVDFLPLSVDYQEKFAAVGRFPGGFFKREAKLSEYEILISRLVDRALRPLFPDDFHAETQVLISLISFDKEILPDALAGLAASAAISVSNIPFNGPISEVRVARINGQFVINPTRTALENADLDIIVAGTMKDINMVEGEMQECSEDDLAQALKVAHEAIKIQCQAQIELAQMVNATVKREYHHENHNEALREAIEKACYDKVYEIAKQGNANKAERAAKFEEVKSAFVATLSEEEQKANSFLINKYFHDVEKDAVRNCVLKERKRLDGRKLDEIRPIWCEVDYLPSAHGSSIFTRGETQSLTTVTLGSKLDEQVIDGAVISGYNKFLLHYNFPPFSTGEVKPMRGTGRREVGHGNLAMRSLKKVLPDESTYTIRVVSDILESNGSSSMATVCAGTLALMDAGVKIKKPVAGIAMGLIANNQGEYAVLSDILGDEDHLGDMDFKVTGTKDGIVACQMDIKVDGLSYEVLAQALNQAKNGRLHILNEMSKAISAPREDYKPHAPRIVVLEIPKEFIGAVIGPGGKIIQEIQRESGAQVSIEEIGNIGRVEISSPDKQSIDMASSRIRGIVAVPEVGETYSGKVKSIMAFGAFIEFMPGKDGLLHISEIEHKRLENMDGIFKEGDMVAVKLIGIDAKTGKFKLSKKALMPAPEKSQNNTPKEK